MIVYIERQFWSNTVEEFPCAQGPLETPFRSDQDILFAGKNEDPDDNRSDEG